MSEQNVSFSRGKLIVGSAIAAVALAALVYLFLPAAEKDAVQRRTLEPASTGQIPPAAPPPEAQHVPQPPMSNVARAPSEGPIGSESAAKAPSTEAFTSSGEARAVEVTPKAQSTPKAQLSDGAAETRVPTGTESVAQSPPPSLPFRTQPVDAPPQADAPQQNTFQRPPSATVTQKPDILFLQRAGVNMRSAASPTSRVVATPKIGTRFEVTNRESNWVQVESGALRGWINGRFLAVNEPQPPETLKLQTSRAGSVPTANIRRTCQTAQKTITAIFGDDTAITLDGCLRQEQEAADHLAKNWATYPSEDRLRCANRTGYMPSYVEWLTCFEMARDVRQIRKDQTDAPTENKAQRKPKKS